MKEAVRELKQFGGILHFIRGKQYIERTKTFDIIKIMPKGCNLNLILYGAVSGEKLVEMINNEPDLLMCFSNKYHSKTLIFTKVKRSDDGCRKYVNVKKSRRESGNPSKFDKKLLSYLILDSAKPECE